MIRIQRDRQREAADVDSDPEPQARRPFLLRSGVIVFVGAMVAGTVLVPLAWQALPDLQRHESYRIGTADIQVTDPPRWVPHDLVDQVLTEAGIEKDSLSILDAGLSERLFNAFRAHPWVSEVTFVRKQRSGRIVVQIGYRRPAAMVEIAAGIYPVDRDGVLLPPEDFSVSDTLRYPLVQNVQTTPESAAGGKWADAAVAGAARLADALLEPGVDGISRWKQLRLRAIRVAGLSEGDHRYEEPILELITQGSSRIIWGRPPGSTHPGELSVEQKVGRLEQYLRDFGAFDEPWPYEIDIRHWHEITRRPLQDVGSSVLR